MASSDSGDKREFFASSRDRATAGYACAFYIHEYVMEIWLMSRISEASSTEDLCGKWHPFVMRIENFMTMDDAKADELAQRVMAPHEQRTALRKKP